MDKELDEGRREAALDFAIKSIAGNEYDDEGRIIVNSTKIVKAAKEFETYLKGETNVRS